MRNWFWFPRKVQMKAWKRPIFRGEKERLELSVWSWLTVTHCLLNLFTVRLSSLFVQATTQTKTFHCAQRQLTGKRLNSHSDQSGDHWSKRLRMNCTEVVFMYTWKERKKKKNCKQICFLDAKYSRCHTNMVNNGPQQRDWPSMIVWSRESLSFLLVNQN